MSHLYTEKTFKAIADKDCEFCKGYGSYYENFSSFSEDVLIACDICVVPKLINSVEYFKRNGGSDT